MDDELHVLLEHLATEQTPHGDREDVARRVTRRRRRRLASAGIVSVLVAALGIGLTLSALSFDRTAPGDSTSPSTSVSVSVSAGPDVRPGPIPTLDLQWSTQVTDTAMPAEVLMDGDIIYVPTSTGVVAYPVDCSRGCAPLWRASVGSAISGPSVTAAQGVVAIVDPKHGVYVFDADCATDGSECQPRWSATPDPGEYFSSASIEQGIVRVTGGTGDAPGQQVRVVAYPIGCVGTCSPTWTADEGTGTIYGLVTVLDGIGYQQVGMTLYGFPSDCRPDAGVCAPDFQIAADGKSTDQTSSLYGPVGDADTIAFAAGDGNVYGYAPHCGTECVPIWVGAASDYLEGMPVLQGDMVDVATAAGIVGFPLACQGKCPPAIQADLGGFVPIEFADGNGLVAASHFGHNQQVVVVPADCSDPCAPSWSARQAGDIFGVTADAAGVFVGIAPHSIVAYPRRCSDGCTPSDPLPIGGEAWWLFERDGRLIVGARSGAVTSTPITLSVFQIG